MNFVSKFDGVLPFTGTHPKAQTHTETVHTKAPADAIIVDDANLLFNGDFKRTGTDLVIAKDDRELVLADYFKGDKRAALASPDGAFLTGKIVDALTGHVQVAQADGSASAAKIIGHVTKLAGNATVIRNGVSIILNNGDNVYQGDVVQCGSNSTLGITFIDGSVFGLGSNAKMVLNEMIYDPNGSSNSSLLSLVQGTISFVAGATAKHGDMKVDTPVATMGIRGTAVLVEIDFEVPASGGAPPARFQVLVEPDGTTGSYVLLDRVTLAPIATVNQAGTVTTVSGQGTVSFLASAQLSPEAMKLISEVFSQKFTDNTNPKTNTNFTDSVVPQTTFPVKFASGETGTATVTVTIPQQNASGSSNSPPASNSHIPGPPSVATFDQVLAERTALTGSTLPDTTSGGVSYADVNAGDVPSVTTAFNQFAYEDAEGHNITAALTAAQLSAIAAVSVPLTVEQDPNLKNYGTATWTYSVQDHALDFLAEGETLTLTYMARVDNNFDLNNETSFAPFTITITGTNDAPTMVVDQTTASDGVIEDDHVNGSVDAAGTLTFDDVDLTDTHTASFVLKSTDASADLPGFEEGADEDADNIGTFALAPVSEVPADADTSGSLGWTFTLNNDNPVLQSLAEGQTITQVYTVTVSDGHGGTVDQDVTVTITGTNDAPVITSNAAAASGAVTEDTSATLTTSGTLSIRDLDLIDTHTAVAAFSTSSSNVHLPGFADGTAHIGQFTIDPSVTESSNDTDDTATLGWTFTLDDDDLVLQSLAAGQTITQVYTVTITDNNGVSVTQDVTITITGANDSPNHAPTIIGELTTAIGTVTEDAATPTLATSGAITFRDVDLIDTHTAGFVLKSTDATADLPGFAEGNSQNAANIGTFALTPATVVNGTVVESADTNNTAVVGWTFTLDNDSPVLQSLAAGQTVTQIYTVTITDNNGLPVTQDVTITITGTNDVPVVAVEDVTGDVTEMVAPTGNLTDSGTIAFTDVDLTDSHSINQPIVASNGALGELTASVTTDTTGTGLGGVVTWDYTVAASYVEYLAAGEVKTEDFTITLDDGHGGTVNRTISVTIAGTNDAPVVAATDVTGAVTELVTPAGNLTDSGTIAFADVDLSDTHSINQPIVASNGALGSLTASVTTDTTGTGLGGVVTWNYSVAASYVEYLAAGEVKVENFTITLDDGNGGTVDRIISVTITGTNDAPVIDAGGNSALTTQEDAALAISGLGYSDVDGGSSVEQLQLSVDHGTLALGSLAGLTGNLDGSDGTLTLNGTAAAINAALASGVTYTPGSNYNGSDTLHLSATDQNAGPGGPGTASLDIGIDITAVNDAPVNAVSAAQGVGEDQVLTFSVANGNAITVSDVDVNETAAPNNTVKVTLAVASGILNAVTGTGAAIADNGTATVTLTGTLAQVNAALDGLTYQGAPDFNGAESLTITTDDLGHTSATAGATLTALGGDFKVNTADGVGNSRQEAPVVAVLKDGSGKFVVTYYDLTGADGSGEGVMAQMYNADGTPFGIEFAVTGAGNQGVPAIAALEGPNAGKFIVTWVDASTGGDIFGRIYDASGAPVEVNGSTAAFLLNSTTAGNQTIPAVTATATGGFVATWTDANGDWSVYGRVFGADGNPLAGSGPNSDGLDFQINTTTAGLQHDVAVVALANGNFVAAWIDQSVEIDVRARVFDATGHAVTVPGGDSNDFLLPSPLGGWEFQPALTALAGGGFVAVWFDDAAGRIIRGRLFNDDGSAVGNAFQIDEDSAGVQQMPSVVGLEGGGFVVVWTDESGAGDGSSYAIMARVFDAAGNVVVVNGSDDNILINSTTANIQLQPVVAARPGGGFVVTWRDNSEGDNDVRARVFDFTPGSETDTDTVAITVTPVNDAPVATDDTLSSVAEDGGVQIISFASLLGNDSKGPANESGQSLTITAVANVVGGTAVINGTNIEFTPAANFNGAASFDYTVRDNGQTNGADDFKTDTGSLSFTITAVNDAPTFTGSSLAATYQAGDGPVAIVSGVVAGDIDSANYAGGSLTATVTAGPQQGDTLSIVGNQYIALSGTDVMYDANGGDSGNPVVIGTLSNNGINSLTFSLNGNADDAAVARLTQAIQFSNSLGTPVSGDRTVTFTLRDGGGTANGGQDAATFDVTVSVDVAETISVAVIGSSDSSGASLAGQLNDDTYYDFAATFINQNAYSSAAAWTSALASYDVVVVGDSGHNDPLTFPGTNFNALYSALRAYVSAGHGVVSTGFYDFPLNNGYNYLSTQATADADFISPIQAGGSYGGPISGTVNVTSGSQITAGISDFSTNPYWEHAAAFDSTATVWATLNGVPVVASGNQGGNLVYLAGIYMGTPAAYDTSGLRTGVQDHLLENAVAWAAAPSLKGGEFQVNTTTANAQENSAVGALEDGGFVIAWVSDGQDGSGTGIYAQRYDSSGARVGGEFLVNTSTPDNQSSPFVEGLADGGYLIAWVTGGNDPATIHARRYDSFGTALGNEFSVGTNGENPSIGALTNGGYVITYTTFDASAGGTYAVIYDANGSITNGPLLVNTYTANYQQPASVVGMADGNFIVSWHSAGQDGDSWGVYFQLFGASGNRLGDEVQANVTTAGSQYGGKLAVLTDGSFVVTWQNQPTGTIVARHFNANGEAISGEVTIGIGADDTVQALPDGGYFVTYKASDGDNVGLFGQCVSASDTLNGAAFQINQTTAGEQNFLSDRSNPTAVLASGAMVSTWYGQPNVDVTEIYARLFTVLQASADTVTTNEGTPVTLSNLTANDATVGSSAAKIVSVYDAQQGTVDLNGGVPVFTPDAGFAGQASFSYWISETANPTPPGTFNAAVNYAMGDFPQAVTLADINGDGKLDLLTSDYSPNNTNGTVGVRLGNGDGTFQSYGSLLAGDRTATPVVVADFNNDGRLDLAVGNFGTDNISIFYGNATGGYNAAVNYDAGDSLDEGPEGLSAADVNGDGNVDLIVSNYNDGTIAVTLNDGPSISGNSTFQVPVEYTVGDPVRSVPNGSLPYLSALADLDSDGDLDIVVGNAGSSDISVLLGNGDGTFGGAVNYATPAGSNAVAIGDVNGDGILDIVSSNGTVSVFLGYGDGTFQPQTSYAAGVRTKGIALADFNQDGFLDVVVGNSRDPSAGAATNSVSILFNDGYGTFGAPVAYATGWDTYGVAVADLNGDGRPDLVAPNELSDNVSVLLNASPGGALSSATVTIDVIPDLVINTDELTVVENGDLTTVYGLSVTPAASATTYTMTVETREADTSVTPPYDYGDVDHINSTLAAGVTYDPTIGQPDTDMVTLRVVDYYGRSDVVNFVFNEAGEGPTITLIGTPEKDVIFATGDADQLTGGAKADQFVFSPEPFANADLITDFHPGEDHIDLRAFSAIVNEGNIDTWFASNVTTSTSDPDDVVITVGANETITLKNVALNALSTNDFIVHA